MSSDPTQETSLFAGFNHPFTFTGAEAGGPLGSLRVDELLRTRPGLELQLELAECLRGSREALAQLSDADLAAREAEVLSQPLPEFTTLTLAMIAGAWKARGNEERAREAQRACARRMVEADRLQHGDDWGWYRTELPEPILDRFGIGFGRKFRETDQAPAGTPSESGAGTPPGAAE